MWTGKLYYLTGGTSKIPRLIGYDALRWNRSVENTSKILSVHGVTKKSRVVVCHPFAPWAIGMIFTEAALRCGSSVYPIGLYAGHQNLQMLIHKIEPTHICATARNLIRWKLESQEYGIDFSHIMHRKMFVAGEALSEDVRRKCSILWNADVINIYGMAEFDTVGAEMPNTKFLTLIPDFEYCLLVHGRILPLEIGLEGELLIRESNTGWHKTGDIFRVIENVERKELCRASVWVVEFIGRENDFTTLSDGTIIGSTQVREILSSCKEIEYLQIHVIHTSKGDDIRLLCVPILHANIIEDKIIRSFLNSSIDIEDSYKHRVIKKIIVEAISVDKLTTTPRGKIPPIIEENPDDAC